MNAAETKKALLTAQRAFDRALHAKTCALASTNMRHGQRAMFQAREGVRENVPAKLEPRHYSPAQRELSALWTSLANVEWSAHENRLNRCGITQMQHEQRAAAARIDKTDSSRERQYRKRPKKKA